MVFNSLTFILFAAVFFPVYFLLKGKGRMAWCLAMSYVFYGWWDWRFLSLIVFSTAIDFYLGQYLGRENDERKRKNALIASMVMNLGFLAIFKYFGFFIDSFEGLIGSELPFHWKIILPVGISFYTFQSMSYTIDVYKRQIPVEHDFIKFAAFIALFPQLVAGPIVRASDLLPQMGEDKKFTWDNFHFGAGRVLWGFFKKVAVADSIAPFVDQCFNAPEGFGSLHLLIGVVFYSFQIYCDFSGYSDIAIGLARIMGFEFPENFKTPYFSKSFSEFWGRWHISLSSWLRDYLYIPLGGNRHGTFNTYKNNMITMLLGGLWHGANWAFVFWGFLHGLYLIVQRFIAKPWKRFADAIRMPNFLHAGISIFVVYIATLVAWVYFRGGSLGDRSFEVSNTVLSRILSFENFSFAYVVNKFQVVMGFLLIGILLFVELTNVRFRWMPRQVTQPAFRMVAYASLLWLICFFGSSSDAFIYFQF